VDTRLQSQRRITRTTGIDVADDSDDSRDTTAESAELL
jgi:hypothetical protein